MAVAPLPPPPVKVTPGGDVYPLPPLPTDAVSTDRAASVAVAVAPTRHHR